MTPREDNSAVARALKRIDWCPRRGIEFISYKALREHLGHMEGSNWRRLVLDRPGWATGLVERGLEETTGPKGAKGLRRQSMFSDETASSLTATTEN